MRIAIIGGGAAGFFAAIQAAEAHAEAEVELLERTGKLLSKLRISGGGRCNVTHACFDNTILVHGYPRGGKELKGAFARFSTADTVAWFQARGVRLKTEADGRMFPITDNSETIAACLTEAADKAGVRIRLNTAVQRIVAVEGIGFQLEIANNRTEVFDKVLIASGGGPTLNSYQWLKDLGIKIVPPVPSLFTFNIADKQLNALSGISLPKAHIKIEGTKLEQEGPYLITHWGISGPAVLKLSAWGARLLQEKDYKFTVRINHLPRLSQEEVRKELSDAKNQQARKQLSNACPFEIPGRLWHWMLIHSAMLPEMKWADVNKKQLNKLTETLNACPLAVNGKSTFKDEFVTAGGISLKEVDLKTMECRTIPGLYFAGEILDIDGVTGGFNFQAAWTTGYIAGNSMAGVKQV